MIQIIEVQTKKQLSEFIKFPDKLYKGNKYRVPQLHIYEKSFFLQVKILLSIFVKQNIGWHMKTTKLLEELQA